MGPAAVRYAMKPVGEPDAGNRHVRFDERGWETERLAQPQATALILDSTTLNPGYRIGTLRPCGTTSACEPTGSALLRRAERHQLPSRKIIDPARLGKSRHAQLDDLCGDVLGWRQRHRVFAGHDLGAHAGAGRARIDEVHAHGRP